MFIKNSGVIRRLAAQVLLLAAMPAFSAAGVGSSLALSPADSISPPITVLNNPDKDEVDGFGDNVLLSGSFAFVADPSDYRAALAEGAVYMFDTFSGDLLRTFVNDQPLRTERYGRLFDVSGNQFAIVRETAADVRVPEIYDVSTGVMLLAIDDAPLDNGDYFGGAVALAEDMLAVNLITPDPEVPPLIHLYSTSSGEHLQTLMPVGNRVSASFGYPYDNGHGMVINEGRVLVGAYGQGMKGKGGAGIAYLYDAASGEALHVLKSPSPDKKGWFGAQVRLDASLALISAPRERTPPSYHSDGAVYTFNTDTGLLLHELQNPLPGNKDYIGSPSGDWFGVRVDLDDVIAVVETPPDENSAVEGGQMLVFHARSGELLESLSHPVKLQGAVSVADNRVLAGSMGRYAGAQPNNRAVLFDLDVDRNGLVDAWELKYNVTDAESDVDNDGLTAREEYQVGSNPNDIDTDGDALDDRDEVEVLGTEPTLADTDRDGVSDDDELNVIGTDPVNPDTDGDGMDDGYERQYGLDPLIADGAEDADNDGLNNLGEYKAGTEPLIVDTDGDQLSDGDEVNVYGSNPFESDSDSDGLSDVDEVLEYGTNPQSRDTDADGLLDEAEVFEYGTNPLSEDTDGDAMPDRWEIRHGLNPLKKDGAKDADSDGLANRREYKFGGSPNLADTDADGLEDLFEVRTTKTALNDRDTDNDRMTDGWEHENGLNPLRENGENDRDSDGLNNLGEYLNKTDPRNPDTDGDKLKDSEEVYLDYSWERCGKCLNGPYYSSRSDPLSPNSDGDIMDDYWEMLYGLKPFQKDGGKNPDGDAYRNWQEYKNGTDPNVADP